ncbi:hypothetical protein V8D89_007947 [Ganoderma adspersum]
MVFSSLDVIWSQSPSARTWTLSVLLVALTGFLWSLVRRSFRTKLGAEVIGNGKTPACLPELLKDDLSTPRSGNGVVNGFAFAREISVPFDVGDVRVSKILVHPIKSCRGTSVQASRYTLEGLENDRKWCIIEQESHAVITAREVAKMVLITPRIEADPTSSYGGRLVISFPEDSGCDTLSVPLNPTPDILANWPIIDECVMFKIMQVQGYVCASLDPGARTPSAILSQYFGQPVHLVMKGPRVRSCPPTHAFPDLKASAVFQDGYPFLVASEESLDEVGRVIGAYAASESPEAQIGQLDRDRWRAGDIKIERFRPNIVFKGSGVPFAEDMWRQVVIHPIPSSEPPEDAHEEEVRTFTLVSKCARCLLPNVDTVSGTRDAAVPYKVLLKFRRNKDPGRMSKPCFGCNAVVDGEGVVKVGDRVTVKEWASGIGV